MNTRYSQQDIEFLRNNYNVIPKEDIMKYLNVSYASLLTKASALGITRKSVNNKLNKTTRVCRVCRKEFPKTKEHFTTFISTRDGEVFQTKCKDCERLYVIEVTSKPEKYLKDLVRGIKREKKRIVKGFDLDYEYVINMYYRQDGKCALTGIDLTTQKGKGLYYSNASIDRIDPNSGYFKSNIQLVCFWANQSKGVLSIEEFKGLISRTNKFLNYEDKK